jgi:hemerythrin-like metal-binding protein
MSITLLESLGLDSDLENEISKLWVTGGYSLDIPVVDLQHLWLIFLILELNKISTNFFSESEKRKKFNEITLELVDFTVEHFNVEEGFLSKYNYPGMAPHKKQHEKFIKVLKNRITETSDEEKIDLSIQKLIKFLKTWLFTHILEHDVEYKNYFLNKKIDLKSYFKILINEKQVTIDKAQAILYSRITKSKEVKEIINDDIILNISQIWNSYNLSVGIPIIDLQHIWLIKMVVELDLASKTMGTSKRDDIFRAIIKNAVQYTKDHFILEEKIMEKFGYVGMQNHIKQHNGFIEFIQARNKENKEGNKLAAYNLVLNLKEWLVSHIAVEDIQITRSLRNQYGEVLAYSKELMSDKLVNIKKSQIELYNHIIETKKPK